MPRDQHPLEVYRFNEMLEDGLEVHEKSMRDYLIEILLELKKLNVHMQLITDESITDKEIDNDYT